MKLSKNFSLREFTKSQTATRRGIDNSPTEEHIENIKALTENVLQPIRSQWGVVSISSGYRSADLNAAIGGSSKSQHSKGEAADFEVPGLDNFDLCEWIVNNLEFDQLILEGYDGKDANSGWIHCSYVTHRKNRKKTLTARFDTGKAVYEHGIYR